MVAKAILAILKSAVHSGKRVKKFLNKSQDEIEDFVVNTLKDKRSINEIIKEDGKAGVNKLDKIISNQPPFKDKSIRDSIQTGGNRGKDRDPKAREILKKRRAAMNKAPLTKVKPKAPLTKQEKWTNEIKKVTEHADNPRRKAKGGMVTKWESKWG